MNSQFQKAWFSLVSWASWTLQCVFTCLCCRWNRTLHLVRVAQCSHYLLSSQFLVWNLTFYRKTFHSGGLCSSCISFANLFSNIALLGEISVSGLASKGFLIHFNNGKILFFHSGRCSSVIFLRPWKDNFWMHNPLLNSCRLLGNKPATRFSLALTLLILSRTWPFRRGLSACFSLQMNCSVFERTERAARQFCSLPFLLTRIWRKEEELFVNLSIKVRDVAPVFWVELHSAEGRDGQTDAWMDGCRNLQNGIGAAPEKSASSKSMLACVPMSCRELARKGSNFRVWFGKWFSLKIAIFEGLLSAGIQSPACSQKHLPCCSRAWWKVEEECLSGSRQP